MRHVGGRMSIFLAYWYGVMVVGWVMGGGIDGGWALFVPYLVSIITIIPSHNQYSNSYNFLTYNLYMNHSHKYTSNHWFVSCNFLILFLCFLIFLLNFLTVSSGTIWMALLKNLR